ncbi:MAG: glycosyltransferase family 4 protein [Phormidesmis sp.]
MAIFVNYYQKKQSGVRGGSVYTAMMAKYMRSHNVNVFNVAWRSQRFIPDQFSKYLTFPYLRLARLSQSKIVHLPGPFNPGCLMPKSKVVTTFHDQVNYEFYKQPTHGQSLLMRLEALAAAKTDYVITPSHFSAERTLARFPKFEGKINVVYPGIDEIFFGRRSKVEREETLKKLSLSPTTPFLLYVGAISPHKNYRRVIESYAQLKGRYPDLKLIMIGSIRRRREFPILLKLVREKKLSLRNDIIIPKQKLSTLELSVLYQSAKVFLFPSFYEGWGIVVGEALASGTPTVISNIPVFKECFSGGALMVDPYSVESIVEGVDALLSTPSLREQHAEKGYKIVAGRTWENTAAETVKVYQKISQYL